MTARAFFLCLTVAGCNKSTPAPTRDAVASASVAPPPSSSSSARVARKVPTPLEVVTAWNAAHASHDTKALAALYAPRVQFYGRTLTGAECVAAKKAAFAKSPDYAQSIRDVVPGEDGVVTFTKTSSSGGKSTDYPAVLVVTDGFVSAETDKITEANLAAHAVKQAKWCETDGDKIVAPYRISAHEAEERVRLSKYFDERYVQHLNPWYPSLDEITCPTKCDRAAHDCGYGLGVFAHGHLTADPLSTPTWNLLEWIYVDAVDATLFYDQKPDGTWEHSEPLPPLSDQ